MQLTIDHHSDVHKIDLTAGLYARLAAVHALVSLGHLMDLQVVVCQHLELAFITQAKRRTDRKKASQRQKERARRGKDRRTTEYDRERREIRKLGKQQEKIAISTLQ